VLSLENETDPDLRWCLLRLKHGAYNKNTQNTQSVGLRDSYICKYVKQRILKIYIIHKHTNMYVYEKNEVYLHKCMCMCSPWVGGGGKGRPGARVSHAYLFINVYTYICIYMYLYIYIYICNHIFKISYKHMHLY
jgi:hypothetical protein